MLVDANYASSKMLHILLLFPSVTIPEMNASTNLYLADNKGVSELNVCAFFVIICLFAVCEILLLLLLLPLHTGKHTYRMSKHVGLQADMQ